MLESNHYNESDLTTIVIPTGLLHETGLSIAAKMAVIVFLELPQNSTNIPNLLAASMGVSNTTVHKHLRDLEDRGWLRRTQLKDEQGRYSGYRYEFLKKKIAR